MVYSKWLRSQRYGNDFLRLVVSDAYYAAYQKHIAFVLAQPSCVVRMAVLSDDEDVVLGFSVVRGNIIDYCHTQRDYRRIGIARALMPPGLGDGTGWTLASLTRIAMLLWCKIPKAEFNPFV
jgi:GNAT superfamily N-acetyltransferase